MNSKVRLEVPRGIEFAKARQEVLDQQQNEKAKQEQLAHQLRVDRQKNAIEKAFALREPLSPFVDVTIDEFKVMFEEEIEDELANQGYYVIYTADVVSPNETRARIYPQMTPETRETIHNHVHLLESEISEMLNDLFGSQKPNQSTYKMLEMVTEILKNDGYDAEITVEHDDTESDCESQCDCTLECPNCGAPVDDEDESEDESDDDCNCEDESEDDCNCEDCGLPVNPDLCEDCGLPQL